MKRVVVSALTTAAILTVLTGSASADPKPTPTGQVGACNMMASWPGFGVHNPNGMGVQSEGGMEHAMDVDNANGNDGMIHATQITGGSC